MEFILTKKGADLLSKVMGGAKLTFTKAESGADISQSPADLASVPNKKQTLQLNKMIEKEGLKGISLTLTNLEVKAEYRLRQIGIYAKTESTEEVLFLIGQDETGERIPAITDREIETEYEVYIKNSSSYQMSLNISSNSFVRKEAIVDNLTTSETDKILSARQGKILKDSLNSLISKLDAAKEVALNVANWEGDKAPFTQVVNIAEVREEMALIAIPVIRKGATKEEVKAASFVSGFEIRNGSLTFYCNNKKPQHNVLIKIKGVN